MSVYECTFQNEELLWETSEMGRLSNNLVDDQEHPILAKKKTRTSVRRERIAAERSL